MVVDANSIVQQVIQKKNGIIKHGNVNIRNYPKYKKDYSWNPSTCIFENSKYLKSVNDISVSKCNCYGYCINKKANVMGSVSIIYQSKKVHCFISDHITIDNYYHFL